MNKGRFEKDKNILNYFEISEENDDLKHFHIFTCLYLDEHGSSHSDAGISFSGHQNKPFSTHNQDNDDWSSNCASSCRGAWWYGSIPGYSCYNSNLNGSHSSSYPCAYW